MQFPPDSSLKVPLSTGLEILPFFICVYLHCLLVILPDTQILRLLLLPVSVHQAYFVITCLDYGQTAGIILGPLGYRPERLGYINIFVVIVLVVFAGRCVEFGLERKCHRRYFQPVKDGRLVEHPITPDFVFMDALELCFNHRGIGWSWSRTPFPSPPEHSIVSHFKQIALDAILLDACLYAAQLLNPSLDSPSGGSLFDYPRPIHPKLLHGAATMLFSVPILMFMLDLAYNVSAVFGRALLGQAGWQWPPIFDDPFSAESLTEFWQRRWQRVVRRMFVQLGARPGRVIGGKAGSIFGAFIVSALLHDWGMWAMSGRSLPLPFLAMFMPHAVGIIMEAKFKEMTGKEVRGIPGRIWTATVLVLCTIWVGDVGFAKSGALGSDFFPPYARPGKFVVDFALGAGRTSKGLLFSHYLRSTQ